MAENSKIGWTHHTMNFWWGCHKVSRECKHCYIGPIMKRGGREPFDGPMRTKNWNKLYDWNRKAIREGENKRVFTCSMSDFFHEGADEWRDEAWRYIRECRNLIFLILTKRIDLVAERLPSDWKDGWPNVWLGVTAGCRESLHRLDDLSEIPAAVRFVSCEPLVERLYLAPYLEQLDWVITGCERAAKEKRQAMSLDWVRDINDDCKAFGVPHFFKQAYINETGVPCERPELDGRVIQEFPAVLEQKSLFGG